ncbi:hypothetical protein ACFVKB_32015 [Rhodococcus sp. NPDC127530]
MGNQSEPGALRRVMLGQDADGKSAVVSNEQTEERTVRPNGAVIQ